LSTEHTATIAERSWAFAAYFLHWHLHF